MIDDELETSSKGQMQTEEENEQEKKLNHFGCVHEEKEAHEKTESGCRRKMKNRRGRREKKRRQMDQDE
jgi:hypothetical protein